MGARGLVVALCAVACTLVGARHQEIVARVVGITAEQQAKGKDGACKVKSKGNFEPSDNKNELRILSGISKPKDGGLCHCDAEVSPYCEWNSSAISSPYVRGHEFVVKRGSDFGKCGGRGSVCGDSNNQCAVRIADGAFNRNCFCVDFKQTQSCGSETSDGYGSQGKRMPCFGSKCDTANQKMKMTCTSDGALLDKYMGAKENQVWKMRCHTAPEGIGTVDIEYFWRTEGTAAGQPAASATGERPASTGPAEIKQPATDYTGRGQRGTRSE